MKAGIANKEVGSEFLSLYTTRISTTGNFILKNFHRVHGSGAAIYL